MRVSISVLFEELHRHDALPSLEMDERRGENITEDDEREFRSKDTSQSGTIEGDQKTELPHRELSKKAAAFTSGFKIFMQPLKHHGK